MTHETRTAPGTDEGTRLLGVSVIAGLAAGLTRPLVGGTLLGVGASPVELHHATTAILSVAVGLHLLYSVVFAAAFVGAVAWTPLDRLAGTGPSTALAGLGYGLALWLVNVAVGWPLVRALLGVGAADVPHLHTGPLVVHLLYGLVLGVSVWLLRN